MPANRHLVLLAEYNHWMNSKLYALCAALPEDALYADRGLFFKSIYLTLNHIAYSDLAFLARFTGKPTQAPALGVELFAGFAALLRERGPIDTRLLTWVSSLAPDWLGASLTYTSKVDGRERTVPNWALLTHVFNHQTHHRGQICTALTQMGHDIGSTDIPFMPRFNQT